MDLLSIQRGVMCSLATNYGLNGKTKEIRALDRAGFRSYYKLFQKAQEYSKDHHDAAATAVSQRIISIKLICDVVPKGSELLSLTVSPGTVPNPSPGLPDVTITGTTGLGVVKRLPSDRHYVVFSDHHITDRANRQDFFAATNKGLYLEILEEYYAVAGFDLIENGDVEELLIYEPDLSEMEDIGSWSWYDIFSYRRAKIEENIRLIASDNSDYYRVIYEKFAAKKKYHKTVGNHDVALMDGELMQLLRDETGYAFEAPVETVILSDDERHRYFICHGNQFDHSCVHGFAQYIGESLSQAGAWAFQGPDRTWRYREDWLDDMLAGNHPVFNHIVGTGPTGMTAGQVAELLAAFSVGAVLVDGI